MGQIGELRYKGTLAEKQKERIMKFKMAGDKHFTEDGRIAEIKFDLVLSVRAKMAQKKVNRPQD